MSRGEPTFGQDSRGVRVDVFTAELGPGSDYPIPDQHSHHQGVGAGSNLSLTPRQFATDLECQT